MATTAEKGVVLERLASHLPDLVVHRSSFPAVPETVNKYGVLLFGDVSGFTALCEQYCNNSHSKKKGTDQLTSTLNLYLSKIVQAILEDGGDILKFAGDALLAHWPCNRPDANSVIQYLIKKSLVMQKKFDNFQTPDDVLLRFKIALSVGKAHIHFIGNQEYRTFDITGPAVDEVTIAQSVTKPGTVVVTRVAWEMCNQELYTADVLEHGFMLISDAREDRENIVNHDQFIKLINRPLRAVNDDILESHSKSSRLTMRKETEALLQNMSAEAEDCLRTYILKTVKHKVDHGYDVSWLSELRQVSVLFINLDPDFSLPTDIVSRKTKEQTLLQTAFESIYPNLVKYNGTLNKIFMFDKGCTFLCIFGLPYASHEDDPERALKAAQAIFNALDNIRLSHYSIGVTTGIAFCGVVGHQERHEYTVIGDKVNMAARLMTKFPDGLTCDDTTRLKSTLPQETFILAPPVKLKGIPTPEDIYFVSTDENENQLSEEKSEIYESNDYESLVGRKAEMERFLIELQHMTEQTQRNPGAIIISGSGGIGKTKLLRAMKSKASSMGIRVVSGTGGLIEQNTPFYTVKTLLTRLLGLDACVNVHDKEQQILQNVTDEKMRKCLPLLNDLLTLKFPQTSFTLQMSHKERRANLHKLLFSIVHKEALSKPCIFGIDDAHRMDQDSWAFFLDLALDSDAVLILASRAIPERDRTPVMAKIFSHPTTIRFRLEGLSSEETASFVCQLLNVQEVDKNLLNVLYSRSHGSPLWCEELVDRMLGSGVLQIVEYNKVVEEKLGYTRVSVGINETRTSVVRSFKQKKCVINETMGIEDIPMPESMAGIVLTRIDNMSPSEQMVLKCAAILGHTFHRKMLQAILPTSSLESFDESLNSLAEAGIIECFVALHIERYDSKVHNHLSGIDIDVNHLECSCMESRRADPAPRLAHQNVNIHSLEKCQLLQFVHTYIQETAVSLWTESQLQSLHETAALYLESEAHKCSSCGGGSFMITAGSSKKRTKQVDGHVNRRRRRRFSMETKVTHFIRDLTRRTQRRSTVASSVTHRVSMVHSDNDINIDDNDPESIDPIRRESTDPVYRGSIDPIRRESTDPVHRGSIDPIRRESTDPVHRGSIDPIRRESTDPVHRGSIDPIRRESTDPVHSGSIDPIRRESTDPVHSGSIDPIRRESTDPVHSGSIDPIRRESTDPVHSGSIDPIRRESTDPVHSGSIDPIRRESTDPVHRGSIDPIRRESTDPVHRGSIDPIRRESTDLVHSGSIDPIRRESTDPVHRGSIDPIRRESTDPVHRGSIDPIRRESTDPVHRGSIDSAYRESIAPVHRVSVVPVHRVSIVADVIEESSDEPSIHNTTKRVSIVLPDNDRTRRSSSIVPSVIRRVSLDNEIEPLDNIRSVIEPLQEEDRGTEAAPDIDFQNCHCDEVLADVYPHLVYHWKLAGNKAKTLHYLIEAAVASLVTFNNMEAISLLEEAEQAVCDGDIGDEDFGQLQIAKLQSLFGQAYFQSGEINECLSRIQKALGVLDSRVPTNKIGVAGNFIWQACKQYLHNKFPQRYIQRKQDTESDMYLEKSRCMSQIVNVYHLQHKSLHAFVAALSQLNIAEEAQEDIHELLTAYAAVIECCQKFNYKRIGDVYIKKSLALCYCTEFGIDDLSTCAHLLNVALNMKLCSGKLAEARDIGKMVIRLTSKIHLDTLKLVALPLLFFANLLTLRKDDCEENLKQLQEIAKKTDNFRTRALHDCCRFDALLELGLNSDREDAIAMDTKKVYCSGDSYHYDDTEKFFITSCIALWHSRGQSAYASTFTDMARSLYLPDFETFFTVQSLAKYLECILEQYLTEQDNRQFRQESEKDLKKLKSLLGRFPMFRGRYFHLKAMYYYARKKKGKAQCSLKKALLVGEEISCPLDIQRAESTLQSWFPSSKS